MRFKIKYLSLFFVVFMQFAVNSHNVDIVITTDTNESLTDEFTPFTYGLEVALCQASNIIIASGRLAYNAFKRYQTGVIPEDSFALDKFSIYRTPDNAFFVFIPIKYMKKILEPYEKNWKIKEEISKNDSAKGYTINEILLRLMIDHPKILKKVSSSTGNIKIDDIVEEIKDLNIKDWFDTLINLFVPGTDEIFPKINMIIEGHGSYPTNINLRLTLNSILSNLHEKDLTIAGFTLPRFRDLLQFLTSKVVVNFLYYSTCYGGDLNAVLAYITSLVAQVLLPSEEKKSKETKSETKPEEAKKSEVVISLKKPNFTIANGSLTSKETYAIGSLALKECVKSKDKKVPIGYVDYAGFFDLLNLYSSKGNRPSLFNDQQLKKILERITPRVETIDDPYAISALPIVMFPGTDKFTVVPLDDKIGVISYVLMRKYQFEKRAIKFVDKEAILIYPDDIPIEVIIEKEKVKIFPSIISMIPGLALHQMQQVTVNNLDAKSLTPAVFWNLIQELFGKYTSISSKYYFIKKMAINVLGGKAPIMFYDVLIGASNNIVDVIYVVNDQTSIFHKDKKLKSSKRKIIRDDDFNNAYANYFGSNPELATEAPIFMLLGNLIPQKFVEEITNALNEDAKKEVELRREIERDKELVDAMKKKKLSVDDIINSVDIMIPDHATLLMIAAFKGSPALVEKLVNFGARTDLVAPNNDLTRKYNIIGLTPLQIAQKRLDAKKEDANFKRIVEFLSKK